MKPIAILVFFILAFHQLTWSQNNDFVDLPTDSLLSWLANNYVDNPSDFHEIALHTLDKGHENGDEQLTAETHLWLMRWHAYHVPFINDSIFHHGEKAIVLFESTGDKERLAETSAELAIEYIEENDLFRSEALIFSAIEIYESLGNKEGLGAAYRRLSSVFVAQKEPDLAIKYGLQALQFTKETNDHYTEALAWMVLIRAYHDANQLDKAIEAGGKCIEVVKEYVPEEVFILARGYGYRGDVWADVGDYQKSLEDNIRSYEIIEAEIGAERPAAKTYRHGIGRAYYMQKKYREAIPHLAATVEGFRGLGQSTQPKMQAIYHDLADSYYQTGDVNQAYLTQQLAHQVFDTLMQDKIKNLEAENLVKYETGKKDQAILEQEKTIQQKNSIQYLSIGFMTLLIIFLSTLFYYYQRNRKVTNVLTVKNKENELLLKEIHHRVKNNLQVISSLLNMQSRNIKDDSIKDVITESRTRVQSMSLIHQKLYRGKNLAAVEMKSYLQNLADNLIDAYSDSEEIEIDLDMQKMELDVDCAIPLGLIVNELITNSLKYAFPKREKGVIAIKMLQEEENIILDISDNGVGKSNSAAKQGSSGFGTELIEMLTLQLKGRIQQSIEEGYHTRLRFPIPRNTQMLLANAEY